MLLHNPRARLLRTLWSVVVVALPRVCCCALAFRAETRKISDKMGDKKSILLILGGYGYGCGRQGESDNCCRDLVVLFQMLIQLCMHPFFARPKGHSPAWLSVCTGLWIFLNRVHSDTLPPSLCFRVAAHLQRWRTQPRQENDRRHTKCG